MGKDNTILSSLFDDTRRMVSAFEGFTGPLDKVQAGDFAEALRLLHEVVEYTAQCTDDHGNPTVEICQIDDFSEYREFLARLSSAKDSSHD